MLAGHEDNLNILIETYPTFCVKLCFWGFFDDEHIGECGNNFEENSDTKEY